MLFTSRYATETGVWHNGLALGQIASHPCRRTSQLRLFLQSHRQSGTSPSKPRPRVASTGPVKAEDRGGFLDLWEGANAIENTSHPYEGTIWDRDNNPMTYKDQYRVDYLTDPR